MQIVSFGDKLSPSLERICMKCQSQFSRKNKKHIVNFLFAELVQSGIMQEADISIKQVCTENLGPRTKKRNLTAFRFVIYKMRICSPLLELQTCVFA